MKAELVNKWELAANEYASRIMSEQFIAPPSRPVVKGAIYAAYLVGALEATEECSRIMKK